MLWPSSDLRKAITRRFSITARIFMPANRIGSRISLLQKRRQIGMVILVAHRTYKLPIQRQTLELWNIGIPTLYITLKRYPIPVVFITKFIIHEAISKYAIRVLNETR